MQNQKINTSGSAYSDACGWIFEETGYDCSNLNREQMDLVGMAAENGALVWDWGNASEEGESEEIAAKIRANRQQLVDAEWTTEAEVIAAYVGGAYDSLNI